MDVLTLDVKGVIVALVLALAMLLIGASSQAGIALGIFYVGAMVYFLALSAVATWTGTSYKKKIRQYQKTRGVKNVLANGLGPLIFVIIAYLYMNTGVLVLAVVGFIASVAAVTSDKFSSEIGILDGDPISIVTSKKLKKGTSGGVTPEGLSAGLTGAVYVGFLIALVYIVLYPAGVYNGAACIRNFCSFGLPTTFIFMVGATSMGGFIGSLVDSYLGFYEEKGIGNKYTSNFVCSLVGGFAGVVFYVVFTMLLAGFL